jgi:putative methylase
MQKRLVRKLELERLLSQVFPHPSPKPNLEQYTIPTDVAATMLYVAAYSYGSVSGKAVLDLGCGTGRLALGAAFLGAKQVVGVDIDKEALKVASENSVRTNLKKEVQWIIGDIDAVHGDFDTVLQNPPFGVQRRRADRRFLEKALESGKMVYSLHKHPEKDKTLIKRLKASKAIVASIVPSAFLEEFIEGRGGRIKAVHAMVMAIPYMFSFHTKTKHEFLVDLYIIERR